MREEISHKYDMCVQVELCTRPKFNLRGVLTMCDVSDDQTFPELAMSRIRHRGALFRRRDWFGQVVDEWLSVTNISDDTNTTTTWTRTRPT